MKNIKPLAIWLVENKVAKKSLAKALGCAQSQVSHYISNDFYVAENGETMQLFKRSRTFFVHDLSN